MSKDTKNTDEDFVSMENLEDIPTFSLPSELKKPNKKHYVFVYGSLREGFGNNVLLSDAIKIGEYVTEGVYHMKDFGAFPAVYPVKSFKRDIPPTMKVKLKSFYRPCVGEIYYVDDIELEDLDALEGNGYFYKRELVDIKGFDKPCWMYICLATSPYSASVSLDFDRNFCWKNHKGI